MKKIEESRTENPAESDVSPGESTQNNGGEWSPAVRLLLGLLPLSAVVSACFYDDAVYSSATYCNGTGQDYSSYGTYCNYSNYVDY